MLLSWLCFLGLTTLVKSSANSIFTNSFLVRFHRSVQNDVVHDIASRNGFENVGAVSRTIFIHFALIRLSYAATYATQSFAKIDSGDFLPCKHSPSSLHFKTKLPNLRISSAFVLCLSLRRTRNFPLTRMRLLKISADPRRAAGKRRNKFAFK